MLTNRESTDQGGGTKRYVVECEVCGFEHTANGREAAMTIGSDHQRETRHDVVALEVPPSVNSP